MGKTIYDVAAAAGVSATTVSRALNRPEKVAGPTRERVLAAVDLLGFEPMAEAVARSRKGPRRVGVIGPFGTHDVARRRLAGILLEAGRDVDLVVYDQPSAESAAAPLLASLPVTGRLDGIIVVSLPLDPGVAERLASRDHPTVLVDIAHGEFTSIQTDDERGGALVADHLADLGHRRFALVGEAQVATRLSPSSRRFRGFRAALRSRGIGAQPGELCEVSTTLDDAVQGSRALLAG